MQEPRSYVSSKLALAVRQSSRERYSRTIGIEGLIKISETLMTLSAIFINSKRR